MELINIIFKFLNKNNIIINYFDLRNFLIKYNEDKTKMKYLFMPDNIDNILSDTSIRKLKIVENMDFIPPEILKNKTINEKSALWSLGIFIYTLFFKEFPFKGNNEKEILEKISKKNIKQTNISKLDDLINNLLVEDPIKRLSWEQYFNHQFFTEKEDTKGDFRQNYIIKEKIGVTDFAKIFKVLDKQNNEIKCLKI